MRSPRSLGSPTLIGTVEDFCCFWKASIISLIEGSNSSVTLRLEESQRE